MNVLDVKNTAASPRAYVLAALPRRQFNQAVSQDLFSSNTPSVKNVFYNSRRRPDAAMRSIILLHPEQNNHGASPNVPVWWETAALPLQVTGLEARHSAPRSFNFWSTPSCGPLVTAAPRGHLSSGRMMPYLSAFFSPLLLFI